MQMCVPVHAHVDWNTSSLGGLDYFFMNSEKGLKPGDFGLNNFSVCEQNGHQWTAMHINCRTNSLDDSWTRETIICELSGFWDFQQLRNMFCISRNFPKVFFSNTNSHLLLGCGSQLLPNTKQISHKQLRICGETHGLERLSLVGTSNFWGALPDIAWQKAS